MHAKGLQSVPRRATCNVLPSLTFCKCISLNHIKTKTLDFHLETTDWAIIISCNNLEPVKPQGVISGYASPGSALVLRRWHGLAGGSLCLPADPLAETSAGSSSQTQVVSHQDCSSLLPAAKGKKIKSIETPRRGKCCRDTSGVSPLLWIQCSGGDTELPRPGTW